MTPASATVAGVGRKAYWTREKLIAAVRRWNDLYGEPPRAADLNPSAAKWSASTWRIERYRLGDPETGEPWPSLNALKKEFGGSLNAAIIAAGLEPNKPGPSRREDVRPDVLERIPVAGEVRVALEAAEARARDAEKRVGVLERRLAKTESARDRMREERDTARRARRVVTRTRTKTKTRKVVDGRARELAEKLRGELAETRRALTEARRDATRLAARLERAETTITEVRADRREIRRDAQRAEDRAAALERVNERLRRDAREVPEPEVREVVKVEREVVHLPSPEQQAVDAAESRAARAERAAEVAEQRAAKAEREYMELAVAATGEARRLTASEMRDLRSGGPSGPAVFAQALRGLAEARRLGGKEPVARALREVASAAMRWKDTL